MATSSKIIIFATTILCSIDVIYCVTPDFSDFENGMIYCADNKSIRLGFLVSKDTKHLMEVNNFKGKFNVLMYVRIAPRSDYDEIVAAQSDYEDTKTKIKENHPDTISSKSGLPDRKVIGIPDFGYGYLRKEGKVSVPCYYFVVEYVDDLSDYIGGTIVCPNGNTIVLDDGKQLRWSSNFNHTFKVATIFGYDVSDTYVRIAPLSNFLETTTTIGDWDNTVLEIGNRDKISIKEKGLKSQRAPVEILSEGTGVLEKDGKDGVPCYYFTVSYRHHGDLTENRSKAGNRSKK